MQNHTITIHSKSEMKLLTLPAAAKMARVSVDFILECERENIIRLSVSKGEKRLDTTTVKRLVRVRHLHRDLGLQLSAIDCILRMRRQIGELQREIARMENHMADREHELLEEIGRLRNQLAFDRHHFTK